MSSTFSSCARERSANGYAPRTSAVQLGDLDLLLGADRRRSAARARRAGCAGSASPRSRPRACAARRPRDSSRSARNFGKMRPFETSSSEWPGAADALQPARDRLRRLDLHDEVDRAHVDAELERRRRDEARDPPRLQVFLDLHALLARQRAVMRARDLFLRELVQPQREPLGEPAVVDEDDRRAVLAHELEQRRIDRRPDRVDARLARRPSAARRPSSRMSSTGTTTCRSSCFATPASTSSIGRAAGDEAADLLERPLRRRERRCAGTAFADEPLEPLDREREVRAALRARDRVHLVDDQRVDACAAARAPATSASGRATRAS